MKKYIVLLFSIISQSCLGGIYAWSVFVAPLQAEHSISKTQAGLVFGVCIASFTLSMLVAGRLLQNIAPRFIGMTGGLLFASGYVIGSFSSGNFTALLLGVGIIAGVGIGFSYICPLSVCINWFPNRKGLVTGIIVAGFGCGAVAYVKIADFMLASGFPVLDALRWTGLGSGAIVAVSSMFFMFPEKYMKDKFAGTEFSLLKTLRNKKFKIMFLGMFCGTFGGLLLVGNLKPIGIILGLSPERASLAVIVFSIGNTIGRIFWGVLFDRLGSLTIALCLMILGLSAAAIGFTGGSFFFYVNIILMSFAFGGCFVLFAAQTAVSFGITHVGLVYPFVFLAYGLAGIVGPPAGGWILENYSLLFASCVVTGIAISGSVLFFKNKVFSNERILA